MRISNVKVRAKEAAGFTLPAILVVTAALLILAVGVLLVTGIERSTARSFVDRQRADLAADAGLENIRGILNLEAANDDFVILQSTLVNPIVEGRDKAPHLFLARGRADAKGCSYRYVPLFSAISRPPEGMLKSPPIEPIVGFSSNDCCEFETLPYQDKVRAAWLPVRDEQGRTVARYAFWVEDMQARIDPEIAGNIDGNKQTHAREPYPFPAPGFDDPATGGKDQAVLNQVALYAIDSTASRMNQGKLGKTLIDRRMLLVSPDSLLAAAGTSAPLKRDVAGHLIDPKARVVEENLVSGILPYDECPVIPFLPGINPSVSGIPKMNLNRIVEKGGNSAVEEMADLINKAYPAFEDRKGGFPENYVKTLAASAIDYADKDGRPTLSSGEYRGIDAYPFVTELALKVSYQNMTVVAGRQYLNFNIRLFAELYNPGNIDITGAARLSYEVALHVDPIGTGTGSPPFDSDMLLGNPSFSSNLATNELEKIGGLYWTKARQVQLRANECKCFLFADVTYHIDQGTVVDNPISSATPFSLLENKGASGSSLMWNDDIVERQQGVVRQQGFIYGETNGVKTGGYLVGTPDVLTKDHLPALLYQKPASSAYYGNTGDPRISHYMNRSRNSPLDESAYPENSSPNRRSVRLDIYKSDAAEKLKVYARALPSEWPDGGHDPPVGSWSPGTSDSTELIDSKFDFPYDSGLKYSAIQMISNRGYYYSVTELGRVFDPIMYQPKFDNPADTDYFLKNSKMPAGKVSWPGAKIGQGSPLYGGGNTLRIGRPEHPAFDLSNEKENRAIGLLDLFHTGRPYSENGAARTGPVVRIQGQVNINTASRDALRALAAGPLVMDPGLARKTSPLHDGMPTMAPPTISLELDAPKNDILADEIADAIIRGRPYASASRLALAKDSRGNDVFGNRMSYPDGDNVQWTDAASEEVFARVYQAATIRSRNFRVWVVAQSLAPAGPASGGAAVLAEVRKTFTIMVDPGKRTDDGAIIPQNLKTKVINAYDF